MNARYWYGLDRHVNPLGFGCWQLSGDYEVDGKPQGWGEIGREEGAQLIRSALESGIQFFDTAAGYGHGRSEEILGEAIAAAGARSSAVICTKIALTEEEEKHSALDSSFAAKVEQSLRRLRTDHVDVLLLHNPRDDLAWQAFDTRVLDGLKAQGKILSYGVSCRSITGARNVIDCGFGSCIEWVFHLLERRPVHDIFPRLKAARMNYIARSPLSRGLLSSRYMGQRELKFGGNEFRSSLQADWIAWTLDALGNFKSLDDLPGGLSAAALRYCLSFEEMSVVIPGVRTARHLADIADVARSGPLAAEALASLEQAAPKCYPPWA